MHIIAGLHKGRRLLSPQTDDVRPTSGRVKEALFSILGDRIAQATVLDLFAGTGAIGIEALSRGAARVVFVESHPISLGLLQANLTQCGFLENSEVYPVGARVFLKQASRKEMTFDVVFADPPYQEDSANTVLPLLGQSAMILPHTVVILEHLTKYQIPPHVGPLNQVRQYRYGDTTLSLFRLAEKAPGS